MSYLLAVRFGAALGLGSTSTFMYMTHAASSPRAPHAVAIEIPSHMKLSTISTVAAAQLIGAMFMSLFWEPEGFPLPLGGGWGRPTGRPL